MVNKKIFLIFILILLISLVYAQSIEVNYPSAVSIEEEFSFKVKLIDFNEGIYDVKIDILYHGNRIARILNNDVWKSTYYYVNDIINENQEKDFSLKIIDDFDEAEVIVKIKDSSDEVETFTGYTIEKSSSSSNESNESYEQEPEEDEEDSEPEIIYINQEKTETKEHNNVVLETINLNTKKNSEEIDKSDYALYSLGVFSLVIILLLLLKKNKYKNEFE